MLAIAVVGCGKSTGSKSKPSPTPTDEAKLREVLTNSASLLRRNEHPWVLWYQSGRERAYEIHWKTSHLRFDEATKNYWGEMETVTGTIFQDDKPAATFSADSGEADKKSSRLALKGHVRVVGVNRQPAKSGKPYQPQELKCDNLEWLSDAKVIKAHTGVTLEGKQGMIGPMDELWGTPDLKIVATPDLFSKP